MRLGVAVGDAAVAPGRAPGVVAVLDQVPGSLQPAGAHVDDHERRGSARRHQSQKSSTPTWLVSVTRQARSRTRRTLLPRSDAVLPLVAGDEAAAGVADERDAQLAHLRQQIAAEPEVVGGGVVRLVDSAVDAAADVLDQAAPQPGIDLPDAVGRIERQSRRFHVASFACPRPGS